MWVAQRIGPFKFNPEEPKSIDFTADFGEISDYNQIYGRKYVRIGIQAPQSPYVTEVDNPGNSKSFKANMNRFKINTDSGDYAINENEILEFGNLANAKYFKVTPLQDMDAYTIIEIQLMEEEEVSG